MISPRDYFTPFLFLHFISYFKFRVLECYEDNNPELVYCKCPQADELAHAYRITNPRTKTCKVISIFGYDD